MDPRIAGRADQLFTEECAALTRRTDRLFAWLMGCQWLAGIAAALWISPRTWSGAMSQTHIHVYAAVFLGGLIASLPIYLAVCHPGRTVTRHAIATGQMLTSALLIHLTGGRLETHFHVFGSLAILAFYRDWRVLITASIVVAGDHLIRGIFWPQSVYGVLSATPWRALEHGAWVAFEDAFLIVSIRRSLDATRTMAAKHAQIESSHELIESEVQARTGDLRRSEERFRSLSASSPIGIFETDESGACVYTNSRWQALCGMGPDENFGDGWTRAVHPEDREPMAALWRETVRAGSEFSHEFRVCTPDGDVRWAHSRSAPIRNPNGSIRGYVGTVEDITEAKRGQAELIRAHQAAVEGARLKSEFVANMSHEVRTPMTSIIGMTELALDTELTREQREFLTAVKTSSDALMTLLDDILDFSKIEAGKLQFESIGFGLRDCVGSALKAMAVRAQQKGLELTCEIDPDVPDRLVGDPGRLRQVILNLVGNAIKFTERGEVSVHVDAGSEETDRVCLRFTVRDTGIGIPPDKQDYIFRAFTQVDGSHTRRYGGTGLGLAISTQLVEMMEGRIGVVSEPGQGSRFRFTALFSRDATVVPERHTPVALHGRRVLVVDDNATNRAIFTRVLERIGVRTLAVESAAAAIKTLRGAHRTGARFDVALVDFQMPDQDGLSLAEAVMGDPELMIPIILLTSAGQSGDAARCRELGVAGYLTKPVITHELIDAIRFVLEGGASQDSRTLVTRHVLREAKSRLRLLLAEDNPVNRSMIARMLEKRGHSVLAVDDGRKVLAALEEGAFDLVLMDVQMPEVDGFEATRAIREREDGSGRHLPIIALTAHAMRGDRERCLNHGMDGYLSKPVQSRDLFAAIEALVGAAQPADPVPARPDGTEVAVFDIEAALRILDHDRELLVEGVRQYLIDSPALLRTLVSAVERGELAEVRRAAHRMRGGLATIAALAGAHAAGRLESLAENGDLEGVRHATSALEHELQRLSPMLQTMLEAA